MGMIEQLRGRRVHFTGIKGTGMTSLARTFSSCGIRVTGSDLPERFYTDELLEALGIPVTRFDPDTIDRTVALLVTSTVYLHTDHAELVRARQLHTEVLTYPQVLARLSVELPTVAVAGTHGKTSVCGMIDHLLTSAGLGHAAVYGSALRNPESLTSPDPALLCIEACEYQRHLLDYRPDAVVLTNAVFEHPDVFTSLEELIELFTEFACSLPEGGLLLYCSDDPGAVRVQRGTAERRPDLRCIGYGQQAGGACRITSLDLRPGETSWSLSRRFVLHQPGVHMAVNMSGALALMREYFDLDPGSLREAVSSYGGTVRRSELICASGGVVVVDDYGHHPEEIAATVDGLAAYYRPERIIIDFVPHTFSRTEQFFDEFVQAFSRAQITFIHPVYPTAREISSSADSRAEELSRTLAAAVAGGRYAPMEASVPRLIAGVLQSGDLFITMGAGNNRWIAREVCTLRAASAKGGGA